MSNIRMASPVDIAISGMRAESYRMQAIANNIANAYTTRGQDGQPYRRMEVILASTDGMSGVTYSQAQPDTKTGFLRVHQPGHPDADASGYVNMPNVQLPVEMMNMVVASRAYQAGAAVMKKHQEIMDVAVELLK
ncbi:MAG: flagellar basal body rod protein FlgC [Planctomycetaceae bacterium]|nr:flagellar basal body rod protein FlgC [Planctomycetaceae bacterium]